MAGGNRERLVDFAMHEPSCLAGDSFGICRGDGDGERINSPVTVALEVFAARYAAAPG